MSSENRLVSYSSPSKANTQEDFSSNLESPFELEEDTGHSSGDLTTTFMMRSQIFPSSKVIDMVTDNAPKIPFHQNEHIQNQEELPNNVLVIEPEPNEQIFEEVYEPEPNEQILEEVYQPEPNPNEPIPPIFEELPTETSSPHFTRHEIRKAPFNFGKTAIATYMMKLIIKKEDKDESPQQSYALEFKFLTKRNIIQLLNKKFKGLIFMIFIVKSNNFRLNKLKRTKTSLGFIRIVLCFLFE